MKLTFAPGHKIVDFQNFVVGNLRFNGAHIIQRKRYKLTHDDKKEANNTNQTEKQISKETNKQTTQTNKHGNKLPINQTSQQRSKQINQQRSHMRSKTEKPT